MVWRRPSQDPLACYNYFWSLPQADLFAHSRCSVPRTTPDGAGQDVGLGFLFGERLRALLSASELQSLPRSDCGFSVVCSNTLPYSASFNYWRLILLNASLRIVNQKRLKAKSTCQQTLFELGKSRKITSQLSKGRNCFLRHPSRHFTI